MIEKFEAVLGFYREGKHPVIEKFIQKSDGLYVSFHLLDKREKYLREIDEILENKKF